MEPLRGDVFYFPRLTYCFTNLTADYICKKKKQKKKKKKTKKKKLIMCSADLLLDARRYRMSLMSEFFRLQFPVQNRFVSSLEHGVLMVSYCDRPMSDLRRAASTICFKWHSYTPKKLTQNLVGILGTTCR